MPGPKAGDKRGGGHGRKYGARSRPTRAATEAVPPSSGALLASVAAQEGDPATVVVLGQGVKLPPLPDGVHGVELPENLGIPGGRNAGVAWLREQGGVDVVLVMDDDGLLPRTDTFRLVRQAFATRPRLGVAGFRIADDTGPVSAGTSPVWVQRTPWSPDR